MKQLLSQYGQTRSRVTRQHALIAPDGHVETPLPGWQRGSGILLISPQMGARHSHYLALMGEGAQAGPPLARVERFVMVLDGEITASVAGKSYDLTSGGYIFLPAGTPHQLSSSTTARLTIYERRYIPPPSGEKAAVVIGNKNEIAGEAFMGDEDITVRKLLPDDARFDMAVNTMTFQPGASLPFAETHFMEHGMLMLTGGGIYRLNDAWYPLSAGDALWMGPYCPQWFGALGKEASSYLLYKETNRDVLQFERES